MKKKIAIIILSLIIIFCLIGCSSPQKDYVDGIQPPEQDNGSEGADSGIIIGNIADRKVIYYVNLNIKSNDIVASLNDIASKVNTAEKEFVESKNQNSNEGSIVLRIKSTRLDEFLKSIETAGETINMNMRSEDISTRYYDRQAQIDSLNTTRKQYEKLLEKTNSYSEITFITEKIAEIDLKLVKLTNAQNVDSSLVDYSVVSISIRKEFPTEKPITFGEKLKKSFANGFSGFGIFLEYLFIAIATLFPILLIAIVVLVIIIVIRKKRKKSTIIKPTEPTPLKPTEPLAPNFLQKQNDLITPENFDKDKK